MERRPRRQLSNVSSTAAATVTATALGATATLTATAIAAVAAAATTVAATAVAAPAIAAAAIPSDRPSSGGLPGPTAEPGQGRTSRWGEQLDLRPPCVARPG